MNTKPRHRYSVCNAQERVARRFGRRAYRRSAASNPGHIELAIMRADRAYERGVVLFRRRAIARGWDTLEEVGRGNRP